MTLEMERETEFVVEANGCCFFCANVLSPVPPDQEQFSPNGGFPVSSLQVLSRYLEIDRRKLFSEGRFIPPRFLAHVENSKLKVELCEECASINDKISQMCEQLTKLEMRVAYELGRILKKLEQVRKSSMHGESNNVDGEKIQVVEALRKDTEQKCSRKISTLTQSPRVLVENFEMKSSSKQMLKFHSSKPDILGEQDIKLEYLFEATPYSKIKMENFQEPEPSMISSIRNDDYDWTVDSELSELEDYLTSDEDFPTIPKTISNVVPEDVRPKVATIPMNSKAPKTIEKNAKGMRGKGRNMSSDKKSISPTTRKRTGSRNWKFDPETGKRKCNDCSKQFNSKRAFTFHYQTIHLKLSYKCVSCKNVFSTKGSLTLHHRTSQRCSVTESAPKFNCHLCEKSFSRKDYLKEHLDGIHFKLQRYACDLCERKFNVKTKLALHKRKLHR